MLSPVKNPLSTVIDKPTRLTNTETNKTTTHSLKLLHQPIDINEPVIKTNQRKLNALTPVNASSLFWLI